MTLLKKPGKSRDSRWPMTRCIVLSLLLVALVARPVFAWSEGGHVAIAELAMRDLSERERKLLNDLAQTLVNPNLEGESDKGESSKAESIKTDTLIRRYGSVSAVAQTAAWVDGLRDLEVRQIFARYGRQVPSELKAYAGKTTADWHYSNLPYFDNKEEAAHFKTQCSLRNRGQLNTVLPLLQRAFASAVDTRDKAIVLAMLVHFVGDAHQPLHGITRVTHGCQHDRGGNGFCTERQDSKGRCKVNLHRVWDSGFGFFYRRDFESVLSAIAAQRPSEPPIQVSVTDANLMQPSVWQRENLALADVVYGIDEGETLNKAYRQKGEIIVRQRAALAAQRLALLLKELTED